MPKKASSNHPRGEPGLPERPPAHRRLNAQLHLRDMHDGETDGGDEMEIGASFSSDTEIPHYYKYLEGEMVRVHETLRHTTGSVRFHTDPLPLLTDHDGWNAAAQIGSVPTDTIRFDSGKMRGTMKFSRNSDLAKEIYRDVIDGHRRNISIGYGYDDDAIEDRIIRDDDGLPSRIERVINMWTLNEVSMVSIPADVSVGVNRQVQGRLHDHQQQPGNPPMPPKDNASPETEPQPSRDIESEREQAAAEARREAQAAAEKNRAAVLALAREHYPDSPEKQIDIVEKSGDDPDAARDLILEMRKTADAAQADNVVTLQNRRPADRGDSWEPPQEREMLAMEWQVDPVKLIRASAAGGRTDLIGAEMEYQQEVARAGFKFHNEGSVRIPWAAVARQKIGRALVSADPRTAQRAQRVMNSMRAFTGAEDSGGNLITTQVRQDQILLVLEEGDFILGAGAQVIMIATPISVPIFSDGVTAQYIDSTITSSSPAESTPNVDGRVIDFKTIAAKVPVARSILDGGAPMAITYLIDMAMTRTSAVLSRAAIHGSGVGANPEGVLTYIGTGRRTAQTTAAGEPSHAELRTLIADVEGRMKDGNMLMYGSTCFLTTPGIKGHVLSRRREAGDARMIAMEMGNGDVMMDAQKIKSWTGIDANTIIYGDWQNIKVGFYGSGFETQIDPYVDSGGQILRVWMDAHPRTMRQEAFGYLARP